LKYWLFSISLLLCSFSFAADNGNNGMGFRIGDGVGFTDIRQQIPNLGADLDASALHFNYFHISYIGVLTSTYLLVLNGKVATELFTADGALRIPDGEVMDYDINVETRWHMSSANSWTSLKSFAPYWIGALNYGAQPILKQPGVIGQLYTMDRLPTLSPVAGIGTSVYFAESALTSSLRLSYPFSAGSTYRVDGGYDLGVQLGYHFKIKSIGRLGVDLWGHKMACKFDATSPITQGQDTNKYPGTTWGLKVYYGFGAEGK
jgi:hypothetical protein